MELPHYLNAYALASARAENVVYEGAARFSVITPQLFRLEYSASGRFEDRATQWVLCRDLGAVDYTVKREDGWLILDSGALELRYRDTPLGFDRNTLRILVRSTGKTWYYSYFDRTNLKGTARTLDGANGAIPLEEGLMSRVGFAAIDDQASLPIAENGIPEPRSGGDRDHDLYFFGYGTQYRECLKDYFRLAGSMPMLPRFAFGNWWSRYWEYTEDSLLALMDECKDRKLPLTVCILDMDWHTVENPYHLGWTGYSFNRRLFPDHRRFLKRLHERKLYTALNLHPSEGIAPHEDMYEDFCHAVGTDPSLQGIIPFRITDIRFIRAYFEVLHHPYEADGVDFWWIDWQQGNKTQIEGLDPLWMLNHLHFLDAGRHPDHRPFFFSRWCGLGGHRYPLGFSGDAQVTWSMLDFEPYFTATAANVGNFFWSHDIGGHYSGIHDPELYVRWVQFGVLSPILRLHSCKNPLQQRLPWMFDVPYSEALMQSLRLRRQMIPYLYTMAFLSHTEAAPLLAPMYYENPECDEAYACPNQYWFGNQLIAAPVTAPADPVMGTSRKLVWLPQGDFYDFQTGEAYRGGRYIAVYADLQSIPLWARSGAVIPLDDDSTSMGCELPEAVEWHIFPGEGSFTLFEDDGISQQFRQGRYAETVVTNRTGEYEGRLSLEVRGDGSVIPPHRRHRFRIKSVGKPDHVTVVSNGLPIPFSVSYDEEALQLTVEVLPASPSDTLEILLTAPDGLALRADFSEKRLRHQITRWKARNDDVWAVISHMEELAADPSRLPSIASQMPFSQMLCVWETLTGSAFCGPDGTSAVPSV